MNLKQLDLSLTISISYNFIQINFRLVLEWKYMSRLEGPGIPKIHCLIRRSDKEYNFLVMEKLDQEDLEDNFQESNTDFSLNKIIMLADQMIQNIEMIHEKGILHNDLKPENMSMGIDAKNSSQLYITDFGMCQPWIEADGSHIKYEGFYFFIFYLSIFLYFLSTYYF